MIIRCAIIEDDKVFMQVMEKYISDDRYLQLTNKYSDTLPVINNGALDNVDVLFLDMYLPSMNGIEFIATLPKTPKLVFMSKSKEFGPDAFDYNAIDYLHKPVSLDRFKKCSERIRKHFAGNVEPPSDFFFIKHGGVRQRIQFNDVSVVKADNNHVILKVNDERIKANLSFKEALALLPDDQFMQVHRSYIVNLKKVQQIDQNVIVVDGKSVPVSGTHLDALYLRLNVRK